MQANARVNRIVKSNLCPFLSCLTPNVLDFDNRQLYIALEYDQEFGQYPIPTESRREIDYLLGIKHRGLSEQDQVVYSDYFKSTLGDTLKKKIAAGEIIQQQEFMHDGEDGYEGEDFLPGADKSTLIEENKQQSYTQQAEPSPTGKSDRRSMLVTSPFVQANQSSAVTKPEWQMNIFEEEAQNLQKEFILSQQKQPHEVRTIATRQYRATSPNRK